MRAWQFDAFGPPRDVLTLREVATPKPGEQEGADTPVIPSEPAGSVEVPAEEVARSQELLKRPKAQLGLF